MSVIIICRCSILYCFLRHVFWEGQPVWDSFSYSLLSKRRRFGQLKLRKKTFIVKKFKYKAFLHHGKLEKALCMAFLSYLRHEHVYLSRCQRYVILFQKVVCCNILTLPESFFFCSWHFTHLNISAHLCSQS